MKKIRLLIILSTLAGCIYAQSSTDAQTILDKAAAKVKAAKGVNISFLLTQKDKLNNIVASSKGVLKIKGPKYYMKQDEHEIFCNGNQIWNYDGQNEVTVAKAGTDEDEFSPQQIVTGFNKEDYAVKLVSSAGTNYQVELMPIDKRKNFKQIMLYINKSTSLITKTSITDKTGGVTEINFSSISLNSGFTDNQFVFDASKHPGVEVINQ